MPSAVTIENPPLIGWRDYAPNPPVSRVCDIIYKRTNPCRIVSTDAVNRVAMGVCVQPYGR